MDVKLRIHNLVKNFPTNNKENYQALQNINLQVLSGEFLTIIGPSGCGKSTLLRCIAGLEQPSLGSIQLNGKNIDGPGPERMMVFQGFDQLFPWLTVIDNIIFPLNVIHKTKNRKIHQRTALHYLELVGLKDYAHFYPYQLSGGMRQRVAIARALSVKPEVLLMDEPFGSLDALTRSNLQQELIKIWEQTASTIIFVTHNIDEAVTLADRIVVFSPGQIKEIIVNDLPRPRLPESAAFTAMCDRLHRLLDINLRPEQPQSKIKPCQEIELAYES